MLSMMQSTMEITNLHDSLRGEVNGVRYQGWKQIENLSQILKFNFGQNKVSSMPTRIQ